MKQIIIIAFTGLLSLILSFNASAQADEIMDNCTKHLQPPFISDGQQYKALLNGDETAEFHATFYEGATYRIAGCSGISDGNLIFRVYDSKRNLLFSNSDYENTPYWDFKFNTTIDCIIEAQLDNRDQSSGFAIMLIGFKE